MTKNEIKFCSSDPVRIFELLKTPLAYFVSLRY